MCETSINLDLLVAGLRHPATQQIIQHPLFVPGALLLVAILLTRVFYNERSQ